MQASGAPRTLTWLRLQTIATVVLALTLLSIMAVVGVLIPPLIIFAVVFFVTAYALRRWGPTRRWVRLVGGILAILALLGNLQFVIEDLLHPESGLIFSITAVSVIASITALVAGIAGFMRAAEVGARPLALGAGALGALLVVLAAVATLTATSDTAQAGDVVIVAEAVEYPETVQAKAGQVALFLENRDRFRHTYAIEARGIEQELPASKNRRLVLDLPAGSYDYVCTVPGHEQMAGVLTVAP